MERHPKDDATFDTEASIVVTFLKREPRMHCAEGNSDIVAEAMGEVLR